MTSSGRLFQSRGPQWQISDLLLFRALLEGWGQIWRRTRKAPSTPATMSKQHCRTQQVERFFRQCRMLLQHCCRFLATMLKQHSTSSKGRNFTIESFDIVAVCGRRCCACARRPFHTGPRFGQACSYSQRKVFLPVAPTASCTSFTGQ